MRFEDEQYVRLYKRDTTTWKMIPWQSRCLLPLILRKLDRAGILDLGEDGLDALAVHLEVPLELVEAGMPALLRRGVLILRADGLLVWPKFIDGQEAKQSDKARQKSSRDRARDIAAAAERGVTVVTKSEHSVTPRDTAVTPCDVSTPEEPTDAADEAPDPVNPSPSHEPDGVSATVTPRDGSVTPRDRPVTPRDATVTRGHTASPGVTLSSAQLSSAQTIAPNVAPADGQRKSAERLFSLGVTAERAVEVYCEAISQATGAGYAFPRERTAREALCDALNGHSKAPTLTDGLTWLRTAVADWAAAYSEHAQFTRGWSPRLFVEWLNAKRPRPSQGARQLATGTDGPSARLRRDLTGFRP